MVARMRWRHVTLNAKPGTRMRSCFGRLMNVMKALKSSVVVYAIIDKTHIHILYRGFYLHQRTWSEIFKVCSNGSYIAWVKEVKTDEHYDNVVAYLKGQGEFTTFINWEPDTSSLEEFLYA